MILSNPWITAYPVPVRRRRICWLRVSAVLGLMAFWMAVGFLLGFGGGA
jgi:hypothetical protein